jgi:hypothetical protein
LFRADEAEPRYRSQSFNADHQPLPRQSIRQQAGGDRKQHERQRQRRLQELGQPVKIVCRD